MKIQPFFDNVLIKPLEVEEKRPSGIIVPDSAKEKPQMGEVLAVGKGERVEGKIIPMFFKVGQKVLYKKWGGNEVKLEGKELILVSEKDLLAVIL